MVPLKIRASVFLLSLSVLSCQASPKTDIAFQKCQFVSQIDGKEDSYALTFPNSTSDGGVTLLVYLHGLGYDFTEPFQIQPVKTQTGTSIAAGLTKEFPQLAILSCNYGKKPSWGTALARTDISNNIVSVMKEHKINHIIVAGNAMGACSALLYVCTAPREIAEKIVGVIAAYPSPDLAELHKLTDAPFIKTTMESALSGKPSEQLSIYRQNSLESNLAFFPRNAKVSIISASENTVIPPKLQKDTERLLKNRDIPVKLISIESEVQPPLLKSLVEAMQFIML